MTGLVGFAALSCCVWTQARRNRTLRRTLTALGHDLRQPLQAAGMFAELLAARLADTPHMDVVERLQNAIDSTGTLLSALIEASILDTDQVTVSRIPTKIAAIMEHVFLQMEPRAHRQSLRFLLHTADAELSTDPLLLERMIRNLLVNALTHTKTGGVLLGCRRRPGKIGIQVVDTGVGIPPDRLERIFDDRPLCVPQTPDGHLRIGLGTVRRTADLLGYAVEVRSRVGKGSSFTIWMACR